MMETINDVTEVPTIFFPGKTIFVDDDNLLMDTLAELFTDYNLSCFTDTELALKAIEKDCSGLLSQSLMIKKDEDDHDILIKDYKKLYKYLLNPLCKDIPLVLFVDYHMPKESGLEFVKKINNPMIKKILFTGEEDLKVAIEAFNHGIIDYFLMKKENNIDKRIVDLIKTMRLHYFNSLSQGFHPYSKTSQEEKEYSFVLNHVFQQINPVEYTMVDTYGSYFMRDKPGKSYWLIIKPINEIHQFADLAEGFCAEESIISSLRRCETLPFFFQEGDEELLPSNWESHMLPCTKAGKYLAYSLQQNIVH